MKVVILAGGYGTRLSEETDIKPKPMVEIGNKPILWHIMKYYSSFGFDDFIICLGYKGEIIKNYFMDYYYNSDPHIQESQAKIDYLKTLIETLEEIINNIRWRHSTIKNMIDWRRFESGG